MYSYINYVIGDITHYCAILYPDGSRVSSIYNHFPLLDREVQRRTVLVID